MLREIVPEMHERVLRPFGGGFFDEGSDWSIPPTQKAPDFAASRFASWSSGWTVGQANIHSVLVARRYGKPSIERYRAGEDECWGEPLGNVAHGPDSKHGLRSVTKSVISWLLGIALDRELIRSTVLTILLSVFFRSTPTCTPRRKSALRCAIS